MLNEVQVTPQYREDQISFSSPFQMSSVMEICSEARSGEEKFGLKERGCTSEMVSFLPFPSVVKCKQS